MAKKEKPAKTKTGGGYKLSGKAKFLMMLGTIGSIILLQQSTVMLLIGMLPAIVAIIVDNTHGKSWAKTVFCFNLAGLLPALLDVYIGDGNTMASLQLHMGDMTMWLTTYGAAGMGWVVIWLSPLIAEQYLQYYYRSCITSCKRKMARLDEEWSIGKQDTAS